VGTVRGGGRWVGSADLLFSPPPDAAAATGAAAARNVKKCNEQNVKTIFSAAKCGIFRSSRILSSTNNIYTKRNLWNYKYETVEIRKKKSQEYK
jgi:hypothetical protein